MDLARISNLNCICGDLAGDAISTRAGPAGPQGGGDGQAVPAKTSIGGAESDFVRVRSGGRSTAEDFPREK